VNGYSYEWIGKEGSGHWRLRDKRDNAIGFCYSEYNARTITDALNAEQDAEALALLRELNDALVIPGWLQPRVDAVLDGTDATPK
jgi:hypothetical protein